MGIGDVDRCRSLLNKALALAAAGKSLDPVAGAKLRGAEIAAALRPIAAAPSISWLVTNGDRVDATVGTEQTRWRVVFGSSDRRRIDWISVTARPDTFDGIEGGRLVVLNGPSGAGKSTLMQSIQAVADVPWVVFDEPENVGAVETGYLIWREQAPSLHAGFLDAIAALARAGNYVALSAAGHSQAELRSCFDDIPTLWVGVYCDRGTLLQREQRPDRWGGIAEASLEVHSGWTYDLTFDTTYEPDPAGLAASIIRACKAPAANG